MEYEMNISEKICTAASIAGFRKMDLAIKLGYSQSSWSQLLKRGKFSEEDLERIADILGVRYYSGFEFPNGVIVGDKIKSKNYIEYDTEKKQEQYDEIIDNLDQLVRLINNIARLADEE